uniref:hypothetical protein n=1 Tax=Inquilinus sp. OTU3971 TaxID=3043855 RepID=UPI00313AE672
MAAADAVIGGFARDREGDDDAGRRGGGAAEADLQLRPGQPRLDAEGGGAAEAQVDIVPEYGGVAPGGGARARHQPAVGVALDDLEAGGQRRLVQAVRQLAQPAAGAGDQAALAQLAPGDEAAPARGAADLAPEAEHGAGRHLDAVEGTQGEA